MLLNPPFDFFGFELEFRDIAMGIDLILPKYYPCSLQMSAGPGAMLRGSQTFNEQIVTWSFYSKGNNQSCAAI
jgi:hypothetical protein